LVNKNLRIILVPKFIRFSTVRFTNQNISYRDQSTRLKAEERLKKDKEKVKKSSITFMVMDKVSLRGFKLIRLMVSQIRIIDERLE